MRRQSDGCWNALKEARVCLAVGCRDALGNKVRIMAIAGDLDGGREEGKEERSMRRQTSYTELLAELSVGVRGTAERAAKCGLGMILYESSHSGRSYKAGSRLAAPKVLELPPAQAH